MAKINKKDNKLNIIKKEALLGLTKKKGITRVSSEALITLNERISEDTEKLISVLKQHIQIKAKKTLEKQDILDVLEERSTAENFDL